jgi:uncharacterized protein
MVEPDRFSFGCSFSEVANTSSAAAAAVSKRLVSLLKQAETLGIPESQIRAFQIAVEPEYKWEDKKQYRAGIRVTRAIELTLHKIENAQDLLDAVVKSDITEITDVRVYSTKEEAVRDKAIEAAVVDARARAERIASSLGAKLGKVHAVSEFEQLYPPQPLSTFAGYAAGLMSDFSGAGPFKPGPIEVTGRVYVVFLIND